MEPKEFCEVVINKKNFIDWISEKTDIEECHKCMIEDYLTPDEITKLESQEGFEPQDACSPAWCYYWHDFLKKVVI